MVLPLFSADALRVPAPADLADWQRICRFLVHAGHAPGVLSFTDAFGEGDLLTGSGEPLTIDEAPALSVPRAFGEAVGQAFYHRSPHRLELIYRVLWRLLHENRDLLEITTDDDTHALLQMAKAVKRDVHKMHAFVRFRKRVGEDGSEHFIAWHRPDHHIVPLATPFFVERFQVMKWSILTPDESVHWDTRELTYGPGVDANPLATDALEDVWRTYYAHTYNPARLAVKTMKKELPVRHWATLPEAQMIPGLIKESAYRTGEMIEKRSVSARDFLPEVRTLETLREAVRHCRGCEIYCNATQPVFGEGPANATCAFIGEQPGDNEDRAGRPFVGPAGQLFDKAIGEVGIERERVYLTGAVKHFKHAVVGNRRLHRNPNSSEISACRPWVLEELKIVQPKMIVCMGVSAAVSILGRQITLHDWRGRFFASALAPNTFVTSHPAAILRTEPDKQEAAYRQFVDELAMVAERLRKLAA